jgi:hypothetical protein
VNHGFGGITVRRSIMVRDGRCMVQRNGSLIGAGPLALAIGTMRPGDVLVLSPTDYRRYRRTAAETVEASS